MSKAQQIIGEILDHFAKNDLTPEDAWAFVDDYSALCLDHRSPDGTKFWLDFERDGTISVLWKPVGAKQPKVLRFRAFAQSQSERRISADAPLLDAVEVAE
jgi:hypothetical protein